MVHRLFRQKLWHDIFELGVALKTLNAAWETISGLFLFWSGHHLFQFRLFQFAAQHADRLSDSTRVFAATYLLMHGVLNIFLVYNLYKNRMWAFPLTIWALGLFLIYQAYRFSHTHSILLLGTMLFDLAFIGLTWHEWHYQKKLRVKVTA